MTQQQVYEELAERSKNGGAWIALIMFDTIEYHKFATPCRVPDYYMESPSPGLLWRKIS